MQMSRSSRLLNHRPQQDFRQASLTVTLFLVPLRAAQQVSCSSAECWLKGLRSLP